jgi:hypothetical protein
MIPASGIMDVDANAIATRFERDRPPVRIEDRVRLHRCLVPGGIRSEDFQSDVRWPGSGREIAKPLSDTMPSAA